MARPKNPLKPAPRFRWTWETLNAENAKRKADGRAQLVPGVSMDPHNPGKKLRRPRRKMTEAERNAAKREAAQKQIASAVEATVEESLHNSPAYASLSLAESRARFTLNQAKRYGNPETVAATLAKIEARAERIRKRAAKSAKIISIFTPALAGMTEVRNRLTQAATLAVFQNQDVSEALPDVDSLISEYVSDEERTAMENLPTDPLGLGTPSNIEESADDSEMAENANGTK